MESLARKVWYGVTTSDRSNTRKGGFCKTRKRLFGYLHKDINVFYLTVRAE